MSAHTFGNWNKRRLAILLLLFFFALAIPTAILIKQAYSQLKWEAFHRHRLMAEELVARIDQRVGTLISNEDVRPFTDYVFLNVAGNDRDNRLQRSQLSAFPVMSTIPGTIGYFQIDHAGRFSTPLMPEDRLAVHDIEENELAERQRLRSHLYQLLSDNQMVEARPLPLSEGVFEAKEDSAEYKDLADSLEKNAISSTLSRARMEASPSPGDVAGMAMDEVAVVQKPVRYEESEELDKSNISEKIEKTENTEKFKKSKKSVKEERVISQRAFDQLGESDSYQQPQSLGRVEDLGLKKTYQQKLSEEPSRQEKKFAPVISKRPSRKEQNVLPNALYPAAGIASLSRMESEEDSPVSIFESEIDAFEFSVLDSGHLVLYRKVWRDSQRYIQGLLLEPEPFITAVIKDGFYNSAVSQSSELAVAFQGNVLSALSSRSARSYLPSTSELQDTELQGTLLLQARMSAPFDRMELIFSVDNLPAGPGGTLLAWTSVVLLVVFCGGFLLMYRLGSHQINLARQQQDFVSAVSHELKTPLTSIRMYGEMLREGWVDEEKRKTYYDYIYNESERLTRLINNVLQLARMTRNDIKVDLKLCRVSELLDSLRSKVQSQVDAAGFKLNIDSAIELSNQAMEADADFFSQIFINLVDNAIKYSAKAGQKQIDIYCQQLRDGQLQISLRDYGPGVQKDQMRKIFKLFYRTGNELTRETVGTGIGLSLVQQLVYAMQGQIDVVNQEPGVEFRIRFPLVGN